MPSITICMFLTLTNGFKLFDQNLFAVHQNGGGPAAEDAVEDHGPDIAQHNAADEVGHKEHGAEQGATSQGTAQAKAVIFFVLVAGLGLAQLGYTRKREVQQ